MSYEARYIYETLMYDSVLHWPIYYPTYTDDEGLVPPSTTGVAAPSPRPSLLHRLRRPRRRTPSAATAPRSSLRTRGRGGEWRIGDFGYCGNGTFRFSRNVEDFLSADDTPLNYSLRGSPWCCQFPVQKWRFGSSTVGINATSPVSMGPAPSFELQYYNQSQHAAILATKSNPLRFAVTHQPLAVRYFKQYYKTVLEDDLRAEFRFEEEKNLCMITGVIKSQDWLHAVFHQSGSSFGLNVGVQPAGFQLRRDYGNISGPSVLTGPTTHKPRKGVFSIPRSLPKENGLEVGDQTLFISRITFKGRLIHRLLKAGGSRPPSPSERPPEEGVDEVSCDESTERLFPDPLDVLLEAMLTLRPDAEAAIASDNDLGALCQKNGQLRKRLSCFKLVLSASKRKSKS
ncbi:hypothetical protein BT69DRAFT_681786 [Atractiella rhizophila]|nr:hypothetical protein BT69DRAFT_681786 [Atractiella rhizophila]